MRINADFSRPAIVPPHAYRWVPSPQDGVERVMLDRVGAEKARATSIVRYVRGAHFPRHLHPGGEEILVLSGTFSDEHGDYPAGWYLRNPPDSGHQPSSSDGTMIFVKLWQMDPLERETVRIDTRNPAAWTRRGDREVCPLFANDGERVELRKLDPHERLFTDPFEPENGAEVLLLAGELAIDGHRYEAGSWIRLPAGQSATNIAGVSPATVYIKTGHLPAMPRAS